MWWSRRTLDTAKRTDNIDWYNDSFPSNWKKASAGWHFNHSDGVTDRTDFDRNDYRLHWLRRSLISINLHACQSQLSLCPVTLTGVPGLIWESRKRIQMRFLRLRDTASSPKRRKQKAGRQKAGETTIGFLSTVSLNLISFLQMSLYFGFVSFKKYWQTLLGKI